MTKRETLLPCVQMVCLILGKTVHYFNLCSQAKTDLDVNGQLTCHNLYI